MAEILHVSDDVRLLNDPNVRGSIHSALADPDVREIVLHPGTYLEHLTIAARAKPLLLRSATGNAEDVVISFDLCQGDRDASGMPYGQACATLTIDADDVTLREVTVRNSSDARDRPGAKDTQAIALRTRGTRITVERCHLLGRQDTVLLDTPSWGALRHVLLTDCLIEGDVDFIYGRATAAIVGGEIRSVGPGYIAAPSTPAENPRGFLFQNVRLTAADGVPSASVFLARPWHPGGAPFAVGHARFVGASCGPHIAAQRWSDMGDFSWQSGGRFSQDPENGTENNDEHDGDRAVDEHLTGWEGLPTPNGSIHVFSDSTASNYGPERAPRTGWAQALAELTEREVFNHAVSGMSTQSLIDSGHLEASLPAIAPGDLVLIGFGHNDPKLDHRHADLYRSYPTNLQRVVIGARSRGATPVLVTSVERRSFAQGRAQATHGGYPEAVRRLAEAEGLAVIDLTRLSRQAWQAMGEEASKAAFLHLDPDQWPGYPDGEADDTHLSHAGATTIARMVLAALPVAPAN